MKCVFAMRHYREAHFPVVQVSPSSLVVLREKYIARAAPSAFGSSPRQGSQDAGCDSVGVMFHVKRDSSGRCTSGNPLPLEGGQGDSSQ